tara:strand:- start:699 stop:953 length:255 start_codon:yes stop_codon:yes gene_type:complete
VEIDDDSEVIILAPVDAIHEGCELIFVRGSVLVPHDDFVDREADVVEARVFEKLDVLLGKVGCGVVGFFWDNLGKPVANVDSFL